MLNGTSFEIAFIMRKSTLEMYKENIFAANNLTGSLSHNKVYWKKHCEKVQLSFGGWKKKRTGKGKSVNGSGKREAARISYSLISSETIHIYHSPFFCVSHSTPCGSFWWCHERHPLAHICLRCLRSCNNLLQVNICSPWMPSAHRTRPLLLSTMSALFAVQIASVTVRPAGQVRQKDKDIQNGRAVCGYRQQCTMSTYRHNESRYVFDHFVPPKKKAPTIRR